MSTNPASPYLETTPISRIFFRAFFGFGFGLAAFYCLTWTILATTVGDIEVILKLSACTLLSAVVSVIFIIIQRKSEVYLPKYQSMAFYGLMAFVSLLTGTILFVHIQSHPSIPERIRIPVLIMEIVVYCVFFVFCLIRISEARFLPATLIGKESNELRK